MPVQAGSAFGPYDILAPLGAGGMGAVFRARDRRLGREVAIKILPDELARTELIDRFATESRAASMLNHPNIVTVYDVGKEEGVPYIAMELVDGRSLREILRDDAPLPLKKVLQIASQVADGLAAAHEKGIVHRDLKPENIVVGKNGFAKIIDFGLAKALVSTSTDDATMEMAADHTRPGSVLGTVGYMSPEQAGGKPVDLRSDQFSFGAILYEMATGRRAFQRATPVETMSAIIRDEPPPLAQAAPAAPLPLRWIIERCMAKEPSERYGSTVDLAHDLQRLREVSSDISQTAVAATPPSPRRRTLTLAAIVVFAAVFVGQRLMSKPQTPLFHRITFRSGFITTARFAPDGQSILYGASWLGRPIHAFTVQERNAESAEMSLPDADVLSVSKSGQIALSLGRRYSDYFVSSGKLATAPISGGGAPRQLLDDVQEADYAPDGTTLAVIRNVSAQSVIEFPLGKVLAKTNGWFSHMRVSRDGSLVAYVDHPVRGDDGGAVAVIDTGGKSRKLTKAFASAQGLAWSADGKEIWFTAADTGFFNILRAVSPDGAKQRVIYTAPGRLLLHDIALNGRVLLAQEAPRVGAVALAPGSPAERDLSWLDGSFSSDISRDGKQLLISEQGEGAGASYAVYLRPTDGGPAARIAEGFASSFSPDGSSILQTKGTQGLQVTIVPTGAGSEKALPPPPGGGTILWPMWFNDGRRIYFTYTTKTPRLWGEEIASGKSWPISPEGYGAALGPRPISPDDRFIAAIGPDGKLALVPTAGGASQPVGAGVPGESPLGFSSDGKTLFTTVYGEMPPRIYRIDLATKSRTLWRETHPPDSAGIEFATVVGITPDGGSYCYTYMALPGNLFLADGLK